MDRWEKEDKETEGVRCQCKLLQVDETEVKINVNLEDGRLQPGWLVKMEVEWGKIMKEEIVGAELVQVGIHVFELKGQSKGGAEFSVSVAVEPEFSLASLEGSTKMTLHVVTEGPEGEAEAEYNVRSEEADYSELDGEYWDQRYAVKAEHDILCIEHEDERFKNPTPPFEVSGRGRGKGKGKIRIRLRLKSERV